jgi:hypothetical protein
MIYLGRAPHEKAAIVDAYLAEHDLSHCVVLSPEKFSALDVNAEVVDWPEIIMYRTFYRLLQEIGPQSLVIFN